jgi:hypothetical protein
MAKNSKKRIPVEVSDRDHKAFKQLAQSQFMTLAGLIRKLLHRELTASNKSQAA